MGHKSPLATGGGADTLYTRAKEIAARSGRTVTSVIEDAMRRHFEQLDSRPSRPPLPVSKETGGPLPGVDLHDGRAMRALLDEGLPIDALH